MAEEIKKYLPLIVLGGLAYLVWRLWRKPPPKVVMTEREREEYEAWVRALAESVSPEAAHAVGDAYMEYLAEPTRESYLRFLDTYEAEIGDMPARKSYERYLEGEITYEDYLDDYMEAVGVDRLPAQEEYEKYLAGAITYGDYLEAYFAEVGGSPVIPGVWRPIRIRLLPMPLLRPLLPAARLVFVVR